MASEAGAPPTADGSATVTLHRQLGPAQQARRARILAAAAELASEGGYEGVAMKEVAARAGVSLGTLYRYFTSKDHLLAEVLRDWGGALGARLRRSPPRGETPAERVAAVFRRMARGVAAQPELGVALTRALLSCDPGAWANREGLVAMMNDWIDTALADDEVTDREGVIDVLQQVCFGAMTRLVNGQRTPRQVGDDLERAARLLLR